jgi:hypothetical protein
MNAIVTLGRSETNTSRSRLTTLPHHGSLLRSLPVLSFSTGSPVGDKEIVVRRCYNCGVWSSDETCRCLKLLPASSLDRREEDEPEFDIGGEGG